MHHAVMRAAEEDDVVEVGFAKVEPMDDMVGVAPRSRSIAAIEPATSIPDGKGTPGGRGHGAGGASDVEYLTGAAGDDAIDSGIAGETAGGLGVDDLA